MSEQELPQECCAKCRFSENWNGILVPTGDDWPDIVCRRYPPTASQISQIAGSDYYSIGGSKQPNVEYNDWCGEFQPRPADKPA